MAGFYGKTTVSTTHEALEWLTALLVSNGYEALRSYAGPGTSVSWGGNGGEAVLRSTGESGDLDLIWGLESVEGLGNGDPNDPFRHFAGVVDSGSPDVRFIRVFAPSSYDSGDAATDIDELDGCEADGAFNGTPSFFCLSRVMKTTEAGDLSLFAFGDLDHFALFAYTGSGEGLTLFGGVTTPVSGGSSFRLMGGYDGTLAWPDSAGGDGASAGDAAFYQNSNLLVGVPAAVSPSGFPWLQAACFPRSTDGGFSGFAGVTPPTGGGGVMFQAIDMNTFSDEENGSSFSALTGGIPKMMRVGGANALVPFSISGVYGGSFAVLYYGANDSSRWVAHQIEV